MAESSAASVAAGAAVSAAGSAAGSVAVGAAFCYGEQAARARASRQAPAIGVWFIAGLQAGTALEPSTQPAAARPARASTSFATVEVAKDL